MGGNALKVRCKPIEIRKTNNSTELSFGMRGDLNNPLFRSGTTTIAGSVIGAVVDYILHKKVEKGIAYGGIGGFSLWSICELINLFRSERLH